MKLLKFWAPWCGPCKQVNSVLDMMSEDEVLEGIEVENVNIDEDSTTAMMYKVRGIPALVLVDAEGAPLWSHTGSITPGKLRDALRDAR